MIKISVLVIYLRMLLRVKNFNCSIGNFDYYQIVFLFCFI